MNRKKQHDEDRSRQARPAVSPTVTRASPKRLWLAGAVAVLVLLAGWLWWLNRPMGPRLPLTAVDLSKADPSVARTLQAHMDKVRKDPESGVAWGWLGALFWTYGDRANAGVCLEQAARLDPSNPRWPYYHALALLAIAPPEAVPKLQQTVALCGSEPPTPRFRLSRVLAELGKWDEAQKELALLLKAKPDFAPARLLTARGAQASGKASEAVALARACTGDPRTARSAWILLATLQRQLGDAQAAAEASQRAAAAPPDEGIPDPFEAEVALLRGDPRGLTEQANSLLVGGHLNEAANLIDRLAREHATHPGTWLLLGRLQLLRNDAVSAEKSLRRYLEMGAEALQGHFQLGLALMAQKRFAEGADSFAKATQLKPDFGPAYYNQGFCLARAGRPREAIVPFTESLRHNPEKLETYLLLADLHLQVGSRESAWKLLDQAKAMSPSDQRVRDLRRRAGMAAP
jgi:tetratricopeptide (TPR) repeat protein